MASVRLGKAISAAFAVVIAAACSSFGNGDDGTSAPPDAGSEATSAGDATSAVDAGADARRCVGGPDGGNTCGTQGLTCGRGQTCCLTGTPSCTEVADCGTTQVNCASPNECDQGKVCCQVSGASTGTGCFDQCAHGVPLCTKDSDCKDDEVCVAPDSSKQIAHWHCAACPL